MAQWAGIFKIERFFIESFFYDSYFFWVKYGTRHLIQFHEHILQTCMAPLVLKQTATNDIKFHGI